MKKIISIFLVLSLVMVLFGCSNTATQEAPVETTAPVEEESNQPYMRRVANFMYETVYDEYESHYEDARLRQLKYKPKLGGCSSVQNGFIRGRNYDWVFDEEPEFVIHVPKTDTRHASVGIAATQVITAGDVDEGIRDSLIEFAKNGDFDGGDFSPVYDLLPYYTLDGINDASLCININVVNYGEMGSYVMKTEDTSDDICPLMVPRLVLDKCTTIDEAVELIKTLDIFSVGTEEEAHYMISGKKSDGSYGVVVVELIPDEDEHYQVNVIDKFVDNKPIMTNFHLTGFDGSKESLTKHPMGYERYLILSDNYDEGKDMYGMQQLMKKVYYSGAYDLYSDMYWYSELAKGDLTMDKVGEKALHGDINKAGAFAEEVKKYDEIAHTATRDSFAKLWHTVHTSIYDCDNKTLVLIPQEGGFGYNFGIDFDF